jgi:hypothetical protein
MLIGYYQFNWNGKDSQGNYILPEGKYHIEVMVKNWSYKSNAIEYFFDKYESQKNVEVVESVVPEPGTLIGSVEKIVSVDEDFEMFLVVKEAKDIIGVEFEFTYNGENLSCDGAEDAGFLGFDGADVEIDQDIGNDSGKVSLYRYAQDDQPDGISGSYAKIAKLVFKHPRDDGKMKVKLFNCKLFYADGSVAKLRYRGGSFKIRNDDDYLVCDLNNDDIVDKYDLIIFRKHYLLEKEDENFDKDCDFNQDEIINIDDLQIFAREYRKMI